MRYLIALQSTPAACSLSSMCLLRLLAFHIRWSTPIYCSSQRLGNSHGRELRNSGTKKRPITLSGAATAPAATLWAFLKTTVASVAISHDSVESSGQSAARASSHNAIEITTPERYNCSYRESFLYLCAVACSHTLTKKDKPKYLFTDGLLLQRIYMTTDN